MPVRTEGLVGAALLGKTIADGYVEAPRVTIDLEGVLDELASRGGLAASSREDAIRWASELMTHLDGPTSNLHADLAFATLFGDAYDRLVEE